jgi:hypothetical protein
MYAVLGNDQLGAYTYDIISNIQFCFTLIITLAIALVPVIISRKVDNLYLNNIINNLRNRKYEDDYLRKIYTKKLKHMSKCTRSVVKFKKIYQANEQNQYEGGDNYADRKMKEIVELYRNNRRSLRNSNVVNIKRNKNLNRAKSMETELIKKLKTLNLKIKNKAKRNSQFKNNLLPDPNFNEINIEMNVKNDNLTHLTVVTPNFMPHDAKSQENIKNLKLDLQSDNIVHKNQKNIIESEEDAYNNENEDYSQPRTPFDLDREIQVYEDINQKIILFQEDNCSFENPDKNENNDNGNTINNEDDENKFENIKIVDNSI